MRWKRNRETGEWRAEMQRHYAMADTGCGGCWWNIYQTDDDDLSIASGRCKYGTRARHLAGALMAEIEVMGW